MGARYRESTTLARLLWERPWDPKFKRYLHRITAPTLIVWGEEDHPAASRAGADVGRAAAGCDPEDLPRRWSPRPRRVCRRRRSGGDVLRHVIAFPGHAGRFLVARSLALARSHRFEGAPVTHKALLLDVGYVIIDVTWRAVDTLGRATTRTMPEPGDMKPTPAYWDKVAVDARASTGSSGCSAPCATRCPRRSSTRRRSVCSPTHAPLGFAPVCC